MSEAQPTKFTYTITLEVSTSELSADIKELNDSINDNFRRISGSDENVCIIMKIPLKLTSGTLLSLSQQKDISDKTVEAFKPKFKHVRLVSFKLGE